MERLSEYPWVVVRFGCALCKRRGQFRLARLAQKFGAEIPLEDLLEKVSWDCPFRSHKMRKERCQACFIDLNAAPKPPDLPSDMRRLRVVK